ncbi:DUF6879 family protein [Streptomyces sp. MCAF7]
MLSSDEMNAYFDQARFEWFRLEALRSYRTAVEQPRFRAYMAGEPYDPDAEPKGWYEEIERRTGEGVAYRKVRIANGPLSDYERWEFEWSYAPTERRGQRTFVLDRAETSNAPDLPHYDYWMIDEHVVLRMHYDDQGQFTGAQRIDAPDEIAAHVRYRDAALAVSVPFPDYWNAHPQYWRQNWQDTAMS